LIPEERQCSADVQAIGLCSDAQVLTRLGKATSCNDICTARSSTLNVNISEVEEESSYGEEEEESESDCEDDTESDISVNREGLHFPPAAMKLSAQPHPGGARENTLLVQCLQAHKANHLSFQLLQSQLRV